VYDEFASVFLIVLAFVYRFDLSYVELGIARDSFVAKFLAEGSQSIPISQLTEEQAKHLASWTKGLFDPDGITDEVMSSCPPQEFYLLVPTLFNQTVFACSSEVLPLETVKNGLEYLLEPFLLPSLVGAIHWMTSYAWEQTHNDVDVVVEMLKRVTRASSASTEGQSMHNTIMMIVSRPLSRCLRNLRRRSSKWELETLITLADGHSKSLRSSFSPCPELSAWLSSPGSLKHAFQTSLQSLITWSTNVTVNPIQHPPPYNHRQLLIAVQLLGAKAVLQILLDEIKARTGPTDPTGAVALDIATALVSAPSATPNSALPIEWALSAAATPAHARGGRPSLADALAAEFERAPSQLLGGGGGDALHAESVVRLHRRVQAQLAAAPAGPPIADLAAAAAQIPAILPGLDIAADAQSAVDAAVAAATQGALDFAAADLAADAIAMDLGADVGADMDLLDAGLGAADDDIFGSLELDDTMDFGLE